MKIRKNDLLLIITWIMGFVFFGAICCFDLPKPVPGLLAAISYGWLSFFSWANAPKNKRGPGSVRDRN